MTKQSLCISCSKRITNTIGSTKFMCPKCAKNEIVRCDHCRQIAAKYSCTSCGFEGPN
ncbi:MAG TPA: zinc finger domain-containing protein [Candidatus Nanoarchaeia archaeon]|nr:zinc finger domain-containing protein [Candidatus Nanoarchaeia archaeon]